MSSIGFWLEGTGKLLEEEETTGERGHEAAGDPGVGSVPEGHPEAGSLPLHRAAKGAIGAADDPIGLKEQAGPDGVGERGDQGCPALEAGQGVLFDGQGMERSTQAVGLGFPGWQVRVIGGKVRLPERDVAHPADSEDNDQFRPLELLQVGDSLGVMR